MKTKKLKLIKELSNDKVEVEDTEGLRWIVGKNAYKKFKQTGFLSITKSLAKEFQSILNGRNFGDMSEQEKYTVIVKIIEGATDEPIENSFPNLSKIQG